MKKLLNVSFLYLMLAMSACALCLSSCGDDDDEGNGGGGGDTGSAYTGTWIMSHIKITEDGETYEGNVDTSEILAKMTLNEDKTFTYSYTDFEDDENDPTEPQQGTWSYADNVLTLHMDNGAVGTMPVKRWTSKQLVTFQSEGGYSETRTWKRV